jgi:glutamine amidotransferase
MRDEKQFDREDDDEHHGNAGGGVLELKQILLVADVQPQPAGTDDTQRDGDAGAGLQDVQRPGDVGPRDLILSDRTVRSRYSFRSCLWPSFAAERLSQVHVLLSDSMSATYCDSPAGKSRNDHYHPGVSGVETPWKTRTGSQSNLLCPGVPAGMTTQQTAASVAVVDYGLGNLRSVTRGLERAGAAVEVTGATADIAAADGIVLPGVGAFGEGMENAGPFRETLAAAAADGTPLFGICLGMQMLLTTSEEAQHAGEGDVEGLDLISGTNLRFPGDVKVPQMGWNDLSVARDHPLVDGVDGEHAYFVHSYYADPDDDAAVVATTDYGVEFPSIIADDAGTVFGTQFHPEKSGETGLRILRNFVDICADGDSLG